MNIKLRRKKMKGRLLNRRNLNRSKMKINLLDLLSRRHGIMENQSFRRISQPHQRIKSNLIPSSWITNNLLRMLMMWIKSLTNKTELI